MNRLSEDDWIRTYRERVGELHGAQVFGGNLHTLLRHVVQVNRHSLCAKNRWRKEKGGKETFSLKRDFLSQVRGRFLKENRP